MTDRAINMKAPEVLALRAGRKVEHRLPAWRIGKLTPAAEKAGLKPLEIGKPTPWQKVRAGDRLWVRETHAFETCRDLGWHEPPFNDGRPLLVTDDPDWGKFWDQPHYRATDPTPDLAYDDLDDAACRWRPSIHMPRWASRLTLVVTEARMERLQDIRETGVIAEGLRADLPPDFGFVARPISAPITWSDGKDWTAVAAFKRLWNSLHGPGAWEANPEVVALRFEVHQANIDSMERAA